MKSTGPVRLYGTTTERSFPLPANTKCVKLYNPGWAEIRYSFVTGKVLEAPSANFPAYRAYEVLGPGQLATVPLAASSGTLYYASVFVDAEFFVTPLVA